MAARCPDRTPPVLYDPGMAARHELVKAWRPAVKGIAEVLHARFTEHAYPMHVHSSWTVLIIDSGAVRYDLDRHEHGALTKLVTLLPPYVPHNGRAADGHGFRKRVLYLDRSQLADHLIGPAVDHPAIVDPTLRGRIDHLHHTLTSPGDELEAETTLTLIRDRLLHHLSRTHPHAGTDPRLAHRLRDLLDSRIREGLTLDEAAQLLSRHPTHLVRAFSREFAMAPHQYLTARRVDRARRLLLQGLPASIVAVETGFYDQPHLTRHFKRILGVSPARYAMTVVPPGSGVRPGRGEVSPERIDEGRGERGDAHHGDERPNRLGGREVLEEHASEQ
ncbi:helix-turn-helix transcriptional regulator [Acrocarpospora phusangensis]|uniref:helix-turn-helix transcriptional regulator n=1 Tax=Acrocarpospora phusangensis TaxID=1070424 RepID=UPI0027DB665B|nr:AraC family transcriptional regulator [Acrocarpospora phusangensis]